MVEGRSDRAGVDRRGLPLSYCPFSPTFYQRTVPYLALSDIGYL